MNNSNKFLSILIFIILWQSISILANTDVFPSVVDILRSFFNHLLNKDLIFHVSITLQRVFIAFIIAMIIGVFLELLWDYFQKLTLY